MLPLNLDVTRGGRDDSPGFAVMALAGLGLGVWVLAKLGHALAKLAEAVAAAAVVFGPVVGFQGPGVAVRQAVTHGGPVSPCCRGYAWWHWLGWFSLVVVIGTSRFLAVAAGRLALVRPVGRAAPAGVVAALGGLRPKLPGWLHACGLSIVTTRGLSW